MSCQHQLGHYFILSLIAWRASSSCPSKSDGLRPASDSQCDSGLALLQQARHTKKVIETEHYESDSMWVTLGSYPGYKGDLHIGGAVKISVVGDALEINWSLTGASDLCNSSSTNLPPNGCGAHVHAGTSCSEASAVGGHYFNKDLGKDPWGVLLYNSQQGKSVGSGTVSIGKGMDISGHAFVVHDHTGARVACGILGTDPPHKESDSAAVTLGSYPGYSGDLQIKGMVKISKVGDALDINWLLKGASDLCNSTATDLPKNACGLHVHAGTSCSEASAVGGHYFNKDLGKDPWGVVVYSSKQGKAVGSGTVSIGKGMADIFGHAFVVHDHTGARVACGVVNSDPPPSGSSKQADPAIPMTSKVTQKAGPPSGSSKQSDAADPMNSQSTEKEGPASGSTKRSDSADSMNSEVAQKEGFSSGSPKQSDAADPMTSKAIEKAGPASVSTKQSDSVDSMSSEVAQKEGSSSGSTKQSDSAWVTLSKYPGYTGDLHVGGTVKIANDRGGLKITWSLTGSSDLCTSSTATDLPANACGLHVHTGTSCSEASAVGGHDFSKGLGKDPWGVVLYMSQHGTSLGSSSVLIGKGVREILGQAFVVHDHTGGRVACGLIGSEAPSGDSTAKEGPIKKADYYSWPSPSWITLDTYPGYEGAMQIKGEVRMSMVNGPLEITWSMTGTDNLCDSTATDRPANSCGLHVHAGKTCSEASAVGGHYFDKQLGKDPWGVVLYTSQEGKSVGSSTVSIGKGMADLWGHAFVVHDHTGARVACGLVSSVTPSGKHREIPPPSRTDLPPNKILKPWGKSMAAEMGPGFVQLLVFLLLSHFWGLN